MKELTNNYEAPLVEIVEVNVEMGFAYSFGNNANYGSGEAGDVFDVEGEW